MEELGRHAGRLTVERKINKVVQKGDLAKICFKFQKACLQITRLLLLTF